MAPWTHKKIHPETRLKVRLHWSASASITASASFMKQLMEDVKSMDFIEIVDADADADEGRGRGRGPV